ERAGEDAVVAGDAARLAGRLHDPVLGALDGIRRTDLGAGGLIAVHADDRYRLGGLRAVDEVELNYRHSLVGVALRAGLDAGVAADAAGRVDVELVVSRYGHRASPRPPLSCRPWRGPAVARAKRPLPRGAPPRRSPVGAAPRRP